MSISTCCKAKVNILDELVYVGEGLDEVEERTTYICQACGQPCAEYDPPCDVCGSMDPCSCAEFMLSADNQN